MNTHESNYKNSILKEVEFKTAYIASFLGAYMAGRYESDCMNGHPGKPYENQPVEDANFLANCAWESIKENL
jgi:hypothetical protein